jgi:hypothetical protein
MDGSMAISNEPCTHPGSASQPASHQAPGLPDSTQQQQIMAMIQQQQQLQLLGWPPLGGPPASMGAFGPGRLPTLPGLGTSALHPMSAVQPLPLPPSLGGAGRPIQHMTGREGSCSDQDWRPDQSDGIARGGGEGMACCSNAAVCGQLERSLESESALLDPTEPSRAAKRSRTCLRPQSVVQ